MLITRFNLGTDPLWREMAALQAAMNHAFTSARPRTATQVPDAGPEQGTPEETQPVQAIPVNLSQNADELVLTAELPGVAADALELSVDKGVLTLRYTRDPQALQEGASYLWRERPVGRFQRSVRLPVPVDAARTEATLEQGLLTVRLPRPEEAKPRRIAVKST